nr:ATP-dependent DNA helicase PIF4-like [Tanacetum cinerariifolium]
MEGYNRLIYDETSYKLDELKRKHQTMYGSLTSEQKGIYSTFMDAVDKNTGGMLFVYRYRGTGKTYLYKTMSAALRSQGQIVLNMESSGIAALLLEGERTAHSRFAIPINILEDSMCHIPADSDLADLIHQSKLIIWDEAPMLQSYCYKAFDRTLRDICSHELNGQHAIRNWKKRLRKKEIEDFENWILNIGNGHIDSKMKGNQLLYFQMKC